MVHRELYSNKINSRNNFRDMRHIKERIEIAELEKKIELLEESGADHCIITKYMMKLHNATMKLSPKHGIIYNFEILK